MAPGNSRCDSTNREKNSELVHQKLILKAREVSGKEGELPVELKKIMFKL